MWYYGEKRNIARGEQIRRQHAHEPYYGTGLVTFASEKFAIIRFSPSPRPDIFMQLLAVRTNVVVGKVLLESGTYDPVEATIIEGSPHPGDVVLGIQNERRYKQGLRNQ